MAQLRSSAVIAHKTVKNTQVLGDFGEKNNRF